MFLCCAEANTSPAVTPYQLKIGLANPGQSTFLQPIENFEVLTGSTISISFWIKADAEEQFNVIFGLDANPITAATTWKEFKFAIPSVQIGAFVTHGLVLTNSEQYPCGYLLSIRRPSSGFWKRYRSISYSGSIFRNGSVQKIFLFS